MKRAAALGDFICNQLKAKHPNQKLYTHSSRQSDLQRSVTDAVNKAMAPLKSSVSKMVANALKTGARGDDDDRRQIIADLISDDRSPFTPEDEEALRFM